MSVRKNFRSWLGVVAMASVLGVPLHASDTDGVVAAADLVDRLLVLTNTDDATSTAASPGVRTVTVSGGRLAPNQGLYTFHNIRFMANSAELTDASAVQLSQLGRALQNDRLRDEIFVIACHVSVTSEVSDRDLSLARARTVRDFLTRTGVGARRLHAVGKGSSEPMARDDPRNDRVELINTRVYGAD